MLMLDLERNREYESEHSISLRIQKKILWRGGGYVELRRGADVVEITPSGVKEK